MRRTAAAAFLFLLPFSSVLNAAEPINGNVILVLEGGLSRGDNHRADIELEFPVRKGVWPEKFWGYATGYNRGHHEGVVVRNEVSGNVRRLTVDVKVGADNWVKGGEATYRIQIEREPGAGGFTGSYTGTFSLTDAPAAAPPARKPPAPSQDLPPEVRKLIESTQARAPARGSKPNVIKTVKVSGKVGGRIDPPWPGLIEGHPGAPGPREHPRLIFRKGDLALMKKRAAETPEGKAIMERFWAVIDEPASPRGDKFSSWPAVGYGFAYQMTGRKEYADKARQIIQRDFFDRGPSGGQDIHHGPRLQGLALAFDLSCDGWDEAFRLKCVDEIQQRVWELAAGKFRGRNMSGFNPNPWSNHNGVRAGCMGLGALAILGEKNSKGEVVEEAGHFAEVAAREARDYLRRGLGGSGWCLEGAFYKGMTLRRGFLHYLHAYEKALGREIDGGTLGDFTMVGYFLEAQPGRVFPEPKAYDGISKDLGVDGESLRDIVWSLGLVTVPQDMMPGVKWLLDHSVGLEGSRTFGIAQGIYAPYVMARYPFDVRARRPSESFRWMAPDPRKGHYVFRPAWKDKDDILLVLNLKSETLGGCHYERSGVLSDMVLHGFGRQWLGGQYLVKVKDRPTDFNELHGPKALSSRETPDRTCVIDMDVGPAYLAQMPGKGGGGALSIGTKRLPHWGPPLADYGVRGTRSLAVDCSGKSGAPLLVAIVDRLTVRDADEKVEGEILSTWSLPVDAKAGPLEIAGNRFTLGKPEGPTFSGVLVAPEKMSEKSVAAEGGGNCYVVFTLQKGPPPEFKVVGQGLRAAVMVGKRTVRFENGSLVLE